VKGNWMPVFQAMSDRMAVDDVMCQREADEYLTADALSLFGYGTITSLLSRLQGASEGELEALIEVARTLDDRGELWYNAHLDGNSFLGTDSLTMLEN